MPPPEAADVAVDQSVVLAAVPLLAVPAAAALVLEELELLHPAASRIDPTVAAAATIAFDARKVKTLPCSPQGCGGQRWHLG